MDNTNDGFDVPQSPIEKAKATLAKGKAMPQGADLAGLQQQAQRVSAERTSARAMDTPVTRNYANEAYVDDFVDDNEQVIDMTTTLQGARLMREIVEESRGFREFAEIEQYEAFMQEPVVIRIHETRDVNEPPLVFVGVNGDERWLPREKKLRLQRKFIERLAQAQEMAYKTSESRDPTADSMMETAKRKAASYSFSVLHDPNPNGRRWLARMAREGVGA